MRTTTRISFVTTALLLSCAVSAQQPPKQDKKPTKPEPTVKVATLGASTRAPTKEEVKKLGLKFEVRARGQIVSELIKDGAATKAGLAAGDVIVRLGNVEVFSQDDIADVLRVSAPGQKLKAAVLRAKTGKEETIEIALGTKEIKEPKVAPLPWVYASLANLDAALAKAKKDKKLVLVGFSGAET